MENILNAFPRNAWGLLCCLQKGCLFLYPLAIGLWASGTAAQERAGFPADTVQPVQLQEVMVVSGRSPSQKADKPLATIDHYLAQSLSLDMVRRGTYAWEPYLNGMASERSVTTIDGMRIYAACTDRMDPVTSYIEVTNLEEAVITSGQHGATGGATIAGGLDLRRKKSYFGEKEFRGTVLGGFESNNRQKIAGADFSYRSQKLYADIDLMYRDAGNYTSGSGRELLYSQFTKYNVSAITGYKISEHQQLEASVIYDHAVDVGYPALPMDVSSAKAVIGSMVYIRHHLSDVVQRWESKVYYNSIAHMMDDTKRPDVPVRMDMPGWSRTAGLYSVINGISGNHRWKANVSAHHNKSRAEMTMFSNTPAENDMFMLTWPGVQTNYSDISLEDAIITGRNTDVTLTAGAAVHNNIVAERFGLQSLQIFYPRMEKSRTRMLPRLAASIRHSREAFSYVAGLSYGERAPGVSEGYGFYLFNSFDRFDYIGNPLMKNEKSAAIDAAVSYDAPGFRLKLSGNYFHLFDYIIGRPDASLSAMTIGAAGVKVYGQLPQAGIANLSAEMGYDFSERWKSSASVSYRRGSGDGVGDLPLMQPFAYRAGLGYLLSSFTAKLDISGAASQHRFNPAFGETALPAYCILNVGVTKAFSWDNGSLLLKGGIENLFDTEYTTFADWNRLPRMGRNFFINISYNF
ncbi:MAG: TonB-dependent receptor plug domain-containing protein [Flavobacterium sp.]|uniref:TonB-dependent receptor plug domain-containing protein n=1 Tax=Flavobacterium sp. J372 TaxID=2898436 RepID=UPI0021511A85|nr:TonB-dependent receptor [Flavobacterium sp. J372]MCR5862593.1 TonB-dependent receptor [Flavobacterium sp. J372]